jgi:hypothetical protein
MLEDEKLECEAELDMVKRRIDEIEDILAASSSSTCDENSNCTDCLQ